MMPMNYLLSPYSHQHLAPLLVMYTSLCTQCLCLSLITNAILLIINFQTHSIPQHSNFIHIILKIFSFYHLHCLTCIQLTGPTSLLSTSFISPFHILLHFSHHSNKGYIHVFTPSPSPSTYLLFHPTPHHLHLISLNTYSLISYSSNT